MRLSLLRALLVAVPAVLMTPGSLHADVFSENFNASTQALGVTTAGQFSTFGGTNVDIVGAPTFPLCNGPESGNCVDMDGTGGTPVGKLQLTTPLTLAAGVYYLSFDLIGSQRGLSSSVTVDFGPFSQTYVLGPNDFTDGVVSNLPVDIAGGVTQLMFISNDPAGQEEGALLDNVVIATTPEPGSLILMTTGLLGCAGAVRRRFATKA